VELRLQRSESMSEPAATRVSRRAFPALSTLAAVFVLPTYRACSGDPYDSPAHFAASNVGSALWIAPVFLAAFAFALLSVRVLARGAVDLRSRRLGLAALGAVAGSLLLGSALEPVQLVFALPALVAGTVMLRQGRGRSPWEVWEHVLGSYALLTLGSFPSVILIGDAFTAPDHLGPGAYVYLGGLAALLGVTLTPRLAALRRRS
jgi:hypothetical protein